ncbi:hypothetical protein [Opitutus sp. ER46]|uniref:hypothetical protein n=1 Tax=Opitutus sp. ER46 TaxID=2161864 RepID=UPI001304DE6C|nr:hypothetical protein [Opitutus sp. ER46]
MPASLTDATGPQREYEGLEKQWVALANGTSPDERSTRRYTASKNQTRRRKAQGPAKPN